VSDAGVATGCMVGRSAGDGDAAASVGGCVGLGSVANWGPGSSSAHAASIKPATSAARHAGQFLRERLIGISQELRWFRRPREHTDGRVEDRRR